MTNKNAQALGKLGGRSRSQKKIDAARTNVAIAREKLRIQRGKNNP